MSETQPLVAKPTGPVPPKIRYTALGFSCLLTFGGYLVFDLCATLQTHMMEYLGINNTQYSLLYVVYAWTNCLMVLFAGALIDNTSNRMCAFLFCALACLGQTILSLGVQFKIFAVMVIGRTVFGTGLGSICVTQNTISNTYFRGADLATAFAATLTISRIGSVTNFLLTPHLYEWWGQNLPIVFWYGTGTTVLSFLAAIFFFGLDKKAEAAGMVVSASRKSKKIKFSDVLLFPPIYWVLCIICSCYYINIFAMMAVLPNFLTVRNDYSDTTASMIASCIYFMAIPCVPVFGRLIDNYGKRLYVLLAAVAILIPFDIILGYTKWNPIPFLCICGVSYSMVASSLWPSICMVVRDECVGSANGIATSIQMLGIGSANLIVGAIKDSFSYTEVMLFLLCCASLAFVMTFVANYLDKAKFNGYLNNHRPLEEKRKAEAKAKAEAEAATNETTPLVAEAQQQTEANVIVVNQGNVNNDQQ